MVIRLVKTVFIMDKMVTKMVKMVPRIGCQIILFKMGCQITMMVLGW